ncbi:MAG: protein serine/threonine phosphatase [Micrococcaceae bacterium]|nr:protein serine/threonine phosphatase [Micrococcaceae bacterium]
MVAERPLLLRYAARSDVGLIRAKNDDSAYAGQYLAVVADGMGGHAGGDVASASTVLDLIHLDHNLYSDDAGTLLADEIQTANSLLSELVHESPKLAGMGTTVTALLLSGHTLKFAHIGDSRAYRLKNGVFEQISVDHTFVQRMIEEGRLRPEDAESHPHKNVLMRVLGDVDASPELDLATFEAEPGERWLLCSDGLNFVRPSLVEDVMRSGAGLADTADTLVRLTLEAGAPDNVSVVVFEVAVATNDDVPTAALQTVPDASLRSAAIPPAGAEGAPGAATASPATSAPTTMATATTAGLQIAAPAAAPAPAAVVGTGTPAAEAGHEPANADADPAGTGGSVEKTEDLGAHLSAEVIRAELAERPHELVGAARLALDSGKIPTIGNKPRPRRAAAVLTHRTGPLALAPEDDEPDVAPPLRRRRFLLLIGAAVIVLALVLSAWLAYAWTQTRYYVGESAGRVAIYNGVSQPLGPISLSHVYRETTIEVSSLPEFSRQRLSQTVPAANLKDAQDIITGLQLGTGTGTQDCSSASATSSPSPTATTEAPSPSGPPTASGSARPGTSTTSSACSGGTP